MLAAYDFDGGTWTIGDLLDGEPVSRTFHVAHGESRSVAAFQIAPEGDGVFEPRTSSDTAWLTLDEEGWQLQDSPDAWRSAMVEDVAMLDDEPWFLMNAFSGRFASTFSGGDWNHVPFPGASPLGGGSITAAAGQVEVVLGDSSGAVVRHSIDPRDHGVSREVIAPAVPDRYDAIFPVNPSSEEAMDVVLWWRNPLVPNPVMAQGAQRLDAGSWSLGTLPVPGLQLRSSASNGSTIIAMGDTSETSGWGPLLSFSRSAGTWVECQMHEEFVPSDSWLLANATSVYLVVHREARAHFLPIHTTATECTVPARGPAD